MKKKSDSKSFFNKLSKNKLLTNKYVLYFVALVAFLDILGYLLRQEFMPILFFYLVGLTTYYYSKNMTVVLGSALLFTSLAHFVKHLCSSYREGLENKEDSEEDSEEDPEVDSNKESVTETTMKNIKNQLKDANANITEGIENKKDTDKEKYQNIKSLSPHHLNIPNKDDLAKQLGEADKIETAYDNLEKVIGENGIKSMSEGTKELVAQQKELLNGLKEITPALNEAMGAISKIDLKNLSGIFDKINVFNK